VLILAIFEAELIGLLMALDSLFFRSRLHLFDLVVITSSFILQLYIYLVRQTDAFGAPTVHLPGADQLGPEAVVSTDDIQGLILFSRAWRFVRVGHGIATSINNNVRAKQEEMAHGVEEMRQALLLLESEIRQQDKKNHEELAQEQKASHASHASHSSNSARAAHAAHAPAAAPPTPPGPKRRGSCLAKPGAQVHAEHSGLLKAHAVLDQLASLAKY
jgi:hypothetical protein